MCVFNNNVGDGARNVIMAVTVTLERNNCYSASKDQQMDTVRRCSVRPMSCVC